MGTCGFRWRGCLLGRRRAVIIRFRSLIPGGRCSQGGVKIPTGGKGEVAQARERLLLPGRRVSRFGAIPKPTVTVRMKENGCGSRALVRGCVVPCALILVLKEESHESDVARPPVTVRAQPGIRRSCGGRRRSSAAAGLSAL